MFITHPSVRIKGTEDNYTPAHCTDADCQLTAPHMHCPFCVKAEVYQDIAIVRVHYRVKHVDKGIDFAGLKILRCCEDCDIVGLVKTEKKFKGAHWHCYRCKNGFNRRDEAIKHYKTHFRNPQTTFQIHITQEVNTPLHYYENQETLFPVNKAVSDISSLVHPAFTQAFMTPTGTTSKPDDDSECSTNGQVETIHVSVGANETLEGANTIMIIQEDQQDPCSPGVRDDYPSLSGECRPSVIQAEDTSWLVEKTRLERQVSDLTLKNQELEDEKSHMVADVQQLKIQVQQQDDEIVELRKKHDDLMQRLSQTMELCMDNALTQLQTQHADLLRSHVDHIRQVAADVLAQFNHAKYHQGDRSPDSAISSLPSTPRASLSTVPSMTSSPSSSFMFVLDKSSNILTPCHAIFAPCNPTPQQELVTFFQNQQENVETNKKTDSNMLLPVPLSPSRVGNTAMEVEASLSSNCNPNTVVQAPLLKTSTIVTGVKRKLDLVEGCFEHESRRDCHV